METIDTMVTKEASVRDGFYQRGTGPEEIVILGSCRTIAFTSYLARWNETIGNNRFTIRRIDPCEWAEVGIAERLEKYESDERMLGILRGCKIFIHEHLVNYGMFNTDMDADKNVYQFGLSCDQNSFLWDINIPQWNDHLILKNDWNDYGQQTPPDYIERGEAEIEKFCALCKLTSFPEFGDEFRANWRRQRYFWRPNHTSSVFTRNLFSMMNIKFLNLKTPSEFINAISQEDLFRDPHTEVTQEDVQGYGLEWR